ncbi:MAG: hypothetical protein MR209_00035 [Veillonellaceae bacterium]|nr:hypothetical protein [Veillonellaceae bacterium]
MKKWLMKLFGIKPEVIVRTVEVEKALPKGSILIVGDKLKIYDITLGVE